MAVSHLVVCVPVRILINMHIDVNLACNKVKALGGRERERRLRVATWNFSGLDSESKQKEIGKLLTKKSMDVVESRILE